LDGLVKSRQVSQVSNSETIYLPPATDVVVKAYTNAAYTQRVDVAPSWTDAQSFQGTGEGNTPMGQTHFTTPSDGNLTLTITMSWLASDGHTWNPVNDVFLTSCPVRSLQLTVMASEDGVDQDYNDSVCIVSWPQPQAQS
jgi:Fucose-binding lectin II (PA-IIL)